MFIVNGKILSEKEQPELFKWYREKCNLIQDTKKMHYMFNSQMKPTFEEDDHGRKRKIKRLKSVPSTSTIYNDKFMESQTWQYVPSANSIRNDNGMLSVVNPRPFVIGNSMNYHKVDDIDIIFFLLYISEALKHKHIFEYDKDRDNKQRAEKSEIAAEAQYLIFHRLSPASPENTGSEDALRQIAMSFGIVGVKDMDLPEIRNKLWDEVMKNDRLNKKDFGFDGLIKAVNKVKDSAKRAIVQTAIELGFLYYSEYKWYLDIKGSKTTSLCNVPVHDQKNKNEYVIEYILKNIEFLDLVRAAVQKPDENKVNEVSDNTEREELIEQAAGFGWDRNVLYKKKNKELIEIVKNELQPASEE